MNIFVLDTDPKIAASMHCDQHLHKMILESAQMLSTAVRHYGKHLPNFTEYYKVTHENHPCNEWLKDSLARCAWLVRLCDELDSLRLDCGAQDSHSSMRVVKLFEHEILGGCAQDFASPIQHIFCGPLNLQYNSSLTVPQKYQEFYLQKQAAWKSEGREMTWKNRKIPDFMLK